MSRRSKMSPMEIVITVLIVATVVMAVILIFNDSMGCGSGSSGKSTGANGRKYECDYHTISLNTEISTQIDGVEVTISGNLFKFITDPLKMTDPSGNVLATADDSYNIISQDDHSIVVDGEFEVCIAGNVDIIGESYDLYDRNGNKVGYADFSAFGYSGGIYDVNGNVAAEYSRAFAMNDYTVTVYDNDICSDKAMLMLVASYVSDYHYDNN